MSTGLKKYLSITTCLFFIVIGCAIKHQGSDRLGTNDKGEPHNSSTYDVGSDTFDDENLKKTGNTKGLEKDGSEQYNFGENGARASSLSSSGNGEVIGPTAQKEEDNRYNQRVQDRDDDDDDRDDDRDDDHDDDDRDDDDDDRDDDHDDDDHDDDDRDDDHDNDDDDRDDDRDDDHDDDDGITNYFSDSANYRILTRYGSTTEIELADYLAPGVTGITFALVSCESSRADYYDTARVENGKLVLESNTLGHVHGVNTQTETVCTVAGKGRSGTYHREFQLYTVSDRKPRGLVPSDLSIMAVRANEADIQITALGAVSYVRLWWRKPGSQPTFRVVSLGNSTATLTIPDLEPETNYEIRVYLMTRQAFDLYRGGNSGSTGALIPEITPASKWITNLSGGGLGQSLTLAITTTAEELRSLQQVAGVADDDDDDLTDSGRSENLSASLFQFDLILHGGMNFIHIPLKVTSVDGQAASIETLEDLYKLLEGKVNYLMVFDSDTQSWVNYFGDRDADRVLRSYEGVIAFMNSAMTLQLAGEPLDSSVYIHSGTSFIGIPRKPSPSYSVSNLLLSVPAIFAIIVEDNGQLKMVARAGDEGDDAIAGGQSFILITTGAADVTFSGEVWGVPQAGE